MPQLRHETLPCTCPVQKHLDRCRAGAGRRRNACAGQPSSRLKHGNLRPKSQRHDLLRHGRALAAGPVGARGHCVHGEHHDSCAQACGAGLAAAEFATGRLRGFAAIDANLCRPRFHRALVDARRLPGHVSRRLGAVWRIFNGYTPRRHRCICGGSGPDRARHPGVRPARSLAHRIPIMNSLPAPNVSHAPAFPLIWVVPLIAVAIGGWMGFRELHNRGPEITIDFADGAGVEAGKTTLEYKGVSAGTVEAVELTPGLAGVSIRLRLRKSAASLASTGAQFWIVRPEIGFSGVHGLDTLVSGVHLDVMPGNGPASKHFIGLDKTPAPDVKDEGRAFLLQSEKLGSLTTGAPVMYREFKVGQVEASRLSE